MSADKRKVSTDALETLGTIIGEGEGRDAIHLAVEPVIAGQRLRPGEDIGIENGVAVINDNPIGIVDPFLKEVVKKGQRFWLVIYPRQITSLRHVWSHPAFEDQPVTITESNKHTYEYETAVVWVNNYANELGVDYDDLMHNAEAYIRNGYIWTRGDEFEGVYTKDEFWTHYATIKNITLDDEDTGNFFSCAC